MITIRYYAEPGLTDDCPHCGTVDAVLRIPPGRYVDSDSPTGDESRQAAWAAAGHRPDCPQRGDIA